MSADARHYAASLGFADFAPCGVRIGRPLGSELPLAGGCTDDAAKVTCEQCAQCLASGPPWRAIVAVARLPRGGARAKLHCGHLANTSRTTALDTLIGRVRRCYDCAAGRPTGMEAPTT